MAKRECALTTSDRLPPANTGNSVPRASGVFFSSSFVVLVVQITLMPCWISSSDALVVSALFTQRS
jgi:hypothetical protein